MGRWRLAPCALVYNGGRRNDRAQNRLALGGGGAKGYAHIGVLRALEQLNIYPDIITGTSMGGLVGGLYAAGLSVDRIERVVRQTGLTVLARASLIT